MDKPNMAQKPTFEWLGNTDELEVWVEQHVPRPVAIEVLPDGSLHLPGVDGQPLVADLGAIIALARYSLLVTP